MVEHEIKTVSILHNKDFPNVQVYNNLNGELMYTGNLCELMTLICAKCYNNRIIHHIMTSELKSGGYLKINYILNGQVVSLLDVLNTINISSETTFIITIIMSNKTTLYEENDDWDHFENWCSTYRLVDYLRDTYICECGFVPRIEYNEYADSGIYRSQLQWKIRD